MVRQWRLPCLFLSSALAAEQADQDDLTGAYVGLERMDARRVLMRAPAGSALPPADAEIMLDALEQWKWRVEMAATGGAVLVSFSMCPHGLGQLPSALGWRGGGEWRSWPGTFEYSKGSLVEASASETFAAIDKNAACEGNAQIRKLGDHTDVGLEDCQRECKQHEGCMAVDYYKETRWCNLYDRACEKPTSKHDGASSYQRKITSKAAKALKSEEMSFYDAKQWCQQAPKCSGFSYSGIWSDRDREGGIPRMVHFSKETQTKQIGGKEIKWHSYIARDNPRAQCNPEGREFECPENPYACLGLSMDADDAAIKQSYRSLSKRLHPDKVKDRTPDNVKAAEAKFRDIANSNELLTDRRARQEKNHELHMQRKRWESDRESIKDLYVSDPIVSSLEPESYPILIGHAQEWLVHFFLPDNDDCKKMKVALALTASDLGIGEEERGLPPSHTTQKPVLQKGDVFRGQLREGTDALKGEGAAAREGDLHIALEVQKNKGKLYLGNDIYEVTITQKGLNAKQKPEFEMLGPERIYTGTFDRDLMTFRGLIAQQSNPKQGVASFVLRREPVIDPTRQAPPGGRTKPRLFGAVNCGRFPEFCKRKGADPNRPKLFPQVRILFPQEVRYEIYKGRALGRDLMAYTREATRQSGQAPRLNQTRLLQAQAGPASLWVVLFHWDLPLKAAQDCELCRTALPMLRRTAKRLEGAGLQLGWLNCTAEAETCEFLGAEEDRADWGALRLFEFGGPAAPAGELQATRSVPLWDAKLMYGKMGQQELLMALESSARMAQFLRLGTNEGSDHRTEL